MASGKKALSPTYSLLKGWSLDMGYQRGSYSYHTLRKKKEVEANFVAYLRCDIYIGDSAKAAKNKTERRAGKTREENGETERLADTPRAILDRSAIAMATGSPRLVFGAASGITAEDLMFSTHLGSTNMVLYSSACSTHSQSLVWDRAAGTQANGVKFSHRVPD